MAALPTVPRAWSSVELPGYREHPVSATYSAFDYLQLPPIERKLDDDLSWLREQSPVRGSLGAPAGSSDPVPARAATREQLDGLIGDRLITPPRSFAIFIGDPVPRTRVRSTTLAYLDLGEFLVDVAGGGSLIHFLSDQQWVLHWLLFVGVDGSQAVVVTDVPFGFADDEKTHRLFDPERREAQVCAESFSEFLYRFWIENEIWLRARDRKSEPPLTDEQRAYAEHYLR